MGNFLWSRPQGLGTFWNMKKIYQCFEVDFYVTLLATIWNMWKGIPFCKFSYNYVLNAHYRIPAGVGNRIVLDRN